MIFLLTDEEDLRIPHFANEATLADDPLNYVSMAEDEEVVKLLLMVAGDVETNPGPMVSAFSSNILHYIHSYHCNLPRILPDLTIYFLLIATIFGFYDFKEIL